MSHYILCNYNQSKYLDTYTELNNLNKRATLLFEETLYHCLFMWENCGSRSGCEMCNVIILVLKWKRSSIVRII
jgi:hypothetical protein